MSDVGYQTVDEHGFYKAFSHYMHSGDSNDLRPFLAQGSEQAVALLSIYRNGFFKGAISALESNFPSVKKLLPDAQFFHLAQTYVAQYPPDAATLVGYGMHLHHSHPSSQGIGRASFVPHLQAHIKGPYTALLYDIGRLDEAWLQTFNAQADQALTIVDIQHSIDKGEELAELPMSMVQNSQLLSVASGVFDLWQQLRFGDEAEILSTDWSPTLAQLVAEHSRKEQASKNKAPKNKAPKNKAPTVDLLLWQHSEQVQVKVLSCAEKHFMQTLNTTYNLGQAAQAARAHSQQAEAPFDLSVVFAELLNAALLQAV